jgi:hypothetical protein
MRNHAQEIDRVLQEVIARASDGLEFETATGAITDGVKAIAKQLEALQSKNYRGLNAPEIARCVSHTVKAMDELYRLLQFAKGAPDSRPDLGGDWLRGLTSAQLQQVQNWVAEASVQAANAQDVRPKHGG